LGTPREHEVSAASCVLVGFVEGCSVFLIKLSELIVRYFSCFLCYACVCAVLIRVLSFRVKKLFRSFNFCIVVWEQVLSLW
jgi:hypothetical protein